MQISASISNSGSHNEVKVNTTNKTKSLLIPPKSEGNGSSINGGELLFLALATCFCNDIYREASKRKMQIKSVEVFVSGEFGDEGTPGFNIQYETKVDCDATEEEIKDLIFYVDQIAEVHNTLRVGTPVTLKN
ncbi:OsmC family protein [Flavihumibacter sp. UBA7668]|uniref:OsmC family protein n=1 Tax=Flavihumibacter sp. UBA7668 TaxID=1946542 RepID=UPI0025BDF464|nr:OsmC family protein [Flavihumibacter sp. UBA7668]